MVHVVITSFHINNHTVRKYPNINKALIVMIVDASDSSDASGPSPLLHRSSSQQEPHTTLPSESGSEHLLEQASVAEQLRLKVVTEPSLRIVFTMAQR